MKLGKNEVVAHDSFVVDSSVMDPKVALWQLLEPFVQELNVSLYEIEVPASSTGVLRVFISKPDSGTAILKTTSSKMNGEHDNQEDSTASTGITVHDCARVNKYLMNLLEEGKLEFFGGKENGWSMEVSSPGINRKLSRREHMHEAIGERVRLKMRSALNDDSHDQAAGNAGKEDQLRVGAKKSHVLQGVLQSFNGDQIVVQDELRGKQVTVDFTNVKEARVDFKF